jgi:hypothetical protein
MGVTMCAAGGEVERNISYRFAALFRGVHLEGSRFKMWRSRRQIQAENRDTTHNQL